VRAAPAHAKINLALVVGPLRDDGKHEVATILQRLDLHDDLEIEPHSSLEIHGFEADTLVRAALERLASVAGIRAGWRVGIEKRIPVASGLGGGSSDAASALVLANAGLGEPLPAEKLHELAAEIGADVPFFLSGPAQLATGDGTVLQPLALPTEWEVLLLLPRSARKESTRAVYERFDARGGARGYARRRDELLSALVAVREPGDLASLPRNDLVSSPLAMQLEELGALRADVSGAGPVVYGLFEERALAERARSEVRSLGETWLTRPV
jgi:4-diphosphocytidyl-2-C-methyl-D-erythritol kinase